MQCYYLFSVSIIWPSRCSSRSFYFCAARYKQNNFEKCKKWQYPMQWQWRRRRGAPDQRLEDECEHSRPLECARAFISFHLIFMSIFVLLLHFVFRCMFDVHSPPPRRQKKRNYLRARSDQNFYIYFFFVSPMLSAHCVASVYCIRLATNEKKYVTATIPSNNFHSIHTTIRNKWHIKDAHLARSCGFAEWNISNLSLESMEHGCLPSNYISHQQLETK